MTVSNMVVGGISAGTTVEVAATIAVMAFPIVPATVPIISSIILASTVLPLQTLA